MVRPRGPDHYRGSQWRLRSTDALGGVLAHLAIHQVDLCCQLLGVPHDMAGFMEAISEHTNVEFRAAIAVVFRSGAIATVIATSDPGRRRSRTAVMDGERQLLIDEEGTSLTADGTTIVAPAPRVPKLRASVYEDVISAMRAGEQPNIASLVSAEGAIRFLELSRTVRRI